MEKNYEKTGNFHFNTNTLKTYNETTGQGKLLSKEKWAALKKQRPRGAFQPPCITHEIVRHGITAMMTTL